MIDRPAITVIKITEMGMSKASNARWRVKEAVTARITTPTTAKIAKRQSTNHRIHGITKTSQ
jgi:hypothetical protein